MGENEELISRYDDFEMITGLTVIQWAVEIGSGTQREVRAGSLEEIVETTRMDEIPSQRAEDREPRAM